MRRACSLRRKPSQRKTEPQVGPEHWEGVGRSGNGSDGRKWVHRAVCMSQRAASEDREDGGPVHLSEPCLGPQGAPDKANHAERRKHIRGRIREEGRPLRGTRQRIQHTGRSAGREGFGRHRLMIYSHSGKLRIFFAPCLHP